MGNGNEVNIYERIFKLWGKISMMIMDGARDPLRVAEILQSIVDTKVYLRRLFTTETIKIRDNVFVVYEMILNGKLAQLFRSLGNPQQFCFASREAVEEFCNLHRDKLRKDYATFFLFKKKGVFVVASVSVLVGDRVLVSFHMLDSNYDWQGIHRHRLVVPQQP